MDLPSFHKLLLFGVEKGVSDIHFEVGYPPHYRLQGELLGAVKVPPLKPSDTEDIARFILDGRGVTIDPNRPFAEIDTSYAIPQAGRFRASIFRQRGSVGIVLRIIPVTVKSLPELNLPPTLAEIAELRRGLVLITGATGNGKSTTIGAMLRHLNEHRRAHVVTIEDPIEFLYEPGKCMIVQRELGTDTLSFRDALQAAMRQDPDVIMVGEIRDRETAGIAVDAALTGHLLLSTLHTNTAATTITRMLDLGVESYLLRSSLLAVLAQRLVRVNCTQCRESEAGEAHMREALGIAPEEQFQRGRGCSACNGQGVRGRRAVYELMEVTPEIRRLIVPGAEADRIHEAGLAQGMRSITQSALELARQGEITLAEAYRVRTD
jgi:pilus retraction protein PilT